MDPKEATAYPVSEASSGYTTSSSPPYSDSFETETLLNKTVGLNYYSGSNGKGTVSEDEDYASGKEEFETGLDNPVLDEGKAIGEGNYDASAKLESLPVSGVMVNDDDDVGKASKDVEGGENVVWGDSEDGLAVAGSEEDKVSGFGGFDGKGESLDLADKLGVNSNEVVVEKSDEVVDGNEGKVVVEEVEINEGESEKEGKSGSLSIVDEAKVREQPEAALVEQEVSEVVDKDDVKLTPEGYSVIESIQVDVAGPGVAVVGETEENGVVPDKPEEKEVVDVAAIEPGKTEVVSLVDVAPMPEGDSVVDTIQVDVPNRELVVGGTEENGAAANELEANEVAEEVGLGDVKLTPAGDSVVDTIQVGMVGPGVAIVGKTEENRVKIEGVEVPLQLVGGSTGSGNGVNEEVSTREVGADNPSFEPAAESSKDVLESKTLEPEHYVVGDENGEKSDAGTVVDLVNGVHESPKSNDSIANGTTDKIHTDGQLGLVDEAVAADRDVNQLYTSDAGTVQTNGVHGGVLAQNDGLADRVSEELELTASAEPKAALNPQEIREVGDEIDEEVHPEDSTSDEDTDGMIFGSSEAAKKFIEDLERESGGDSHTGADSSFEQSQRLDGQIVTDSEEEGDTDDEGDGKELFDSAALAALLKAATGADSDGGSITITSQDGSRLFSVERPAGLGSSLRSLRPAPRPTRPNLFSPAPASGGESEDNLSEEEKKKLEKLQQIRVKFLRLVHRLGLSPEESVAAQVLYRLALLGGRQGIQTFSLDAAKRMALQLEAGESDDLDFSVDILVLGKSGVGKSATINSIFGEEKAPIDPFETGTASAKEISGLVDGVKVRIVDTPGLKSSVMEQGFNRSVLSSVKKFTKKSSPDVVLYVDRLDAQSRDLNDLPLLKTVTSALGSSIWRSAIVTLTHAASAPPDGPSGSPLSYEVFVSQRSHVVQQSIGHAVGDLRMMSPSLMNPVSLVENHPSCRKNREGQKILPNGQSWRPQLLLLCYSMKILSEASSLSKPQDPFDHRKLFGFRARAPPLPYMLSSMLQSRAHPKLPSDQGGENVDSDIDLDDLSDSDQEEEDEYDQLPPFKPLKKAQLAKLSREQRKAYFEEYDYRVKLLQKKQWREDGSSGGSLPDMALPPSFDGDNPAYRYRFLEPTSQFLARPVLDSHGWDHDCGYDGVNLEHSLAIANHFPLAYTVQITKDKKDFTISLDSSISAKHGENMSSMAGFDIQSENVVPGVKIEDEITLGKQYVLVGSAGAVRSQHDTAYGANFELQRRELDYPIGQVQSTLSMSIIKWRGDLALGFNSLAQFSIGRNSKVAVRAGINNKLSGQVTVRTSSSEHLSLALAAIIPTALSIYKKLFPTAGEKYSIY
ncbi:UNVERIFIED_CONTAM: Translocase of chloroplast, chloroplastic [Sesamum calycinum]|uniref:Translocase of chloroplast, chloroplastic n=1 Tax=Sesamum calycinum TaxID=2727403 RepID=A0AAW2SBC1_9LAMI